MRRAVRNALQHWSGEGLLTAQQVAELSASLEAGDREQDSRRAVRIFAAIGAVLIGLGAVLFVGSNWDGLSPMARSLVLLGGYGAVVAAAALAGRHGLDMVAEALWLLATLVLGANIFLLAQTYNLSLTLWQGTLGWMIGALALGYARRSAAQAAVAVPLGILTLGWVGGGSGWFFDDQVQFLFADDGLRPVFGLLGLALVALSLLLARRAELAFARGACFRWGLVLVAGTLVLTTAHVDLASTFFDADLSIKQLLVMAAAAGLVIAAALWGEVASRRSRIALPAALVFLAAPLIAPGGTPWLGSELGGMHLLFALYVLLVFGLALFTIWLGIDARNTRLVNVGMTSTALLIIIQYFGWSFQLLDRSLAFIAGGIVLIGLATVVEKSRRRIVAQIAR